MTLRLLTKKQVCEKIGYSRAHLDRLVNDPDYAHWCFPKPIALLSKRLWDEREVDAWILAQLDKR